MHEADKKLINAQRLLMGGAVIMGVLIFIIYYRKKKEESLEREHQMQLYAYTTEINNLETKKENALAQIWELTLVIGTGIWVRHGSEFSVSPRCCKKEAQKVEMF